jgi:hypothetical protein
MMAESAIPLLRGDATMALQWRDHRVHAAMTPPTNDD